MALDLLLNHLTSRMKIPENRSLVCHGKAVAWAAGQTGIKCTVVVPRGTPQVKVSHHLKGGCLLGFFIVIFFN